MKPSFYGLSFISIHYFLADILNEKNYNTDLESPKLSLIKKVESFIVQRVVLVSVCCYYDVEAGAKNKTNQQITVVTYLLFMLGRQSW